MSNPNNFRCNVSFWSSWWIHDNTIWFAIIQLIQKKRLFFGSDSKLSSLTKLNGNISFKFSSWINQKSLYKKLALHMISKRAAFLNCLYKLSCFTNGKNLATFVICGVVHRFLDEALRRIRRRILSKNFSSCMYKCFPITFDLHAIFMRYRVKCLAIYSLKVLRICLIETVLLILAFPCVTPQSFRDI
jgi:hypothetical protein